MTKSRRKTSVAIFDIQYTRYHMWDPYAEFDQFTLLNGLTVHTLDLPGREWVRVCCVVHAGCERDPIGKEGVAHFVEHMVSKNMYVPYLEMRQYFESLGGSVSFGATNAHATRYEFFVPNKEEYVGQALDWFGDLLFSRKLVSDIEHERGVITREFNRKYPLLYRHDRALSVYRNQFPSQWYARQTSSLGTLESIASLTPEDLQDFYDTYYTPANVEVVCVGGLEGLSTSMFSGSQMAQRKPGKQFFPNSPITDIPLPLVSRDVFSLSSVTDAKTEQASCQLRCMMQVPEKRFIMNLTRRVTSDIMFEHLRVKLGLVYSVGVSVINLRDHVEFSISCSGIEPAQVEVVESIIKELISDLKQDEFRFLRCKNQFLNEVRMHDQAGGDILCSAREAIILNGQIISDAEDIQDIERVTFLDVQKVLSVLDSPRTMVVLEIP